MQDNPDIKSNSTTENGKSNMFNLLTKNSVLIIAILIAAWLVGMSIIIAGWLISAQIAKNNSSNNMANSIPATEPVKQSYVDIEIPAGLPTLGNKDAKVSMVIFADFQCPFCGDWQKTLFPPLKKKYIDTGLVRFAYMDFAFLGEESTKAAEATRCAADQGKFWEFHDALFAKQKGENEGSFSDTNLIKLSASINLNATDFEKCFSSREYKDEVENHARIATTLVVDSTPTVFINGHRYEGLVDFAEYENRINSELNK